MNIFKKMANKTVDAVKEVASEETSTKLDMLGDLAKIGIFIFMCVSAVKGASSGGSIVGTPVKKPDLTTMIINNYYYDSKKEGK